MNQTRALSWNEATAVFSRESETTSRTNAALGQGDTSEASTQEEQQGTQRSGDSEGLTGPYIARKLEHPTEFYRRFFKLVDQENVCNTP